MFHLNKKNQIKRKFKLTMKYHKKHKIKTNNTFCGISNILMWFNGLNNTRPNLPICRTYSWKKNQVNKRWLLSSMIYSVLNFYVERTKRIKHAYRLRWETKRIVWWLYSSRIAVWSVVSCTRVYFIYFP